MSADEPDPVPTSEDILDAELVARAIAAAGAGNSVQAADLTTALVFNRTSEEVYGVCCGVAQSALNAVALLNEDPDVAGPEGGGPWTVDHLRPGPRPTDPGEFFAYAFVDGYSADGAGGQSTIDLHNAMVSGGIAYVTYCVSHLIRQAGHLTYEAVSHLLAPGGGRSQ